MKKKKKKKEEMRPNQSHFRNHEQQSSGTVKEAIYIRLIFFISF